MVAYGFPRGEVGIDLGLAARIGASVLEVLPHWSSFPDPVEMGRRAADGGFRIHSAHGTWGGTTIRAGRVDLGSTDPVVAAESLEDLRRCLDWLAAAGGTHLVVHPGGFSDPADSASRRAALVQALGSLADHVAGAGLVVCVENMPCGVHPGERMADLAAIVAELGRAEVALCLDTGHAHIVANPARETRAAGSLLRSTHVHDNTGRDLHDPPGRGTIDWDAWAESLDEIEYRGPVMLECIRALRRDPSAIDAAFLALLDRLTRRG